MAQSQPYHPSNRRCGRHMGDDTGTPVRGYINRTTEVWWSHTIVHPRLVWLR